MKFSAETYARIKNSADLQSPVSSALSAFWTLAIMNATSGTWGAVSAFQEDQPMIRNLEEQFKLSLEIKAAGKSVLPIVVHSKVQFRALLIPNIALIDLYQVAKQYDFNGFISGYGFAGQSGTVRKWFLFEMDNLIPVLYGDGITMFSRDNAFSVYAAMQKLKQRIVPGITEDKADRLQRRYMALSDRLANITATEVGIIDAEKTVQ